MRLMMVSQDFPPAVGGVQSYAFEVASRLVGRAERTVCVAPSAVGSVPFDTMAPVEIRRVLGTSDWLPVTGAFVVPRIARALRADVALHVQWQTAAASLVSRAITGYPRVVAIAAHGRELLLDPFRCVPGGHAAFSNMRRAILRGADAVLSVSRFTGDLVRQIGVDSKRAYVVQNGVDAERFRPVDPSSFVREHGIQNMRRILTVGRLVRRKGVDTMLEAMPDVLHSFPNAVYVIAGVGPDLPRLKSIVNRLGLDEHVRFVGRVEDRQLRVCYSSADVFVTAAREEPPSVEGFGLVFLEAGACGIPVVGTRAGGIEDAIVDGETGELVEPNDPRALAQTVKSLLHEPSRARKMGEAGRRRATAEASWDRSADAIFSILSACLTERTKVGRFR